MINKNKILPIIRIENGYTTPSPDIYEKQCTLFAQLGSGVSCLKICPDVQTANCFAPQRKNLLCWYNVLPEDKILSVGDECGAVTGIFAAEGHRITAITEWECSAKVYAGRFADCRNLDIRVGDVSDILSGMETAYSLIIILPQYAKKEILEACLKVLIPGGRILIIADNRLGLKFRAGCKDLNGDLFTGIVADNRCALSKNEWEKCLKSLKKKSFKFFYPYPDYCYADEIFSDNRLPKNGSLATYPYIFNGDRIRALDEEAAIAKILNDGTFCEYANSFIIEIADNLSAADYIKVSCERNEDYRICTTISTVDNEKTVIKCAANKHAAAHIKSLSDNYKEISKYLKNSGVFVCPIEQTENGAKFPFVEGVTLGELINYAISQNDMNALLGHIATLKNIVFSLDSGRSFARSFRFGAYFGDIELPATLNSATSACIDLIADNIIVNEKLNLIDYEWVLPFPVPVEFIMFRSLFHNKAISTLPPETKAKIYRAAGVPLTVVAAFTIMEEIFQRNVSRDALKFGDLAQMLNPAVLNTAEIPLHQFRTVSRAYALCEPPELLGVLNATQQEITFDFSLKGTNPQHIAIEPVNGSCLIKIKSITAKKGSETVEIKDFTTNADLVIIDDYYFGNVPKITIANNGFYSVSISFFIFKHHDSDISRIADLLKENNALKIENAALKEAKSTAAVSESAETPR